MADETPKEGEEEHKCPKVRRHKKHHGHHGGAWKVAFADFVTAMMALFLLLWLLASSSQSQKESLAQYFKDPGVFKTHNIAQVNVNGAASAEKSSPALAKAKEAEGKKDKKAGEDGEGTKGPDQATVDSLTAKVKAAMKTGDGRLVGYLQITQRRDSLRVTMINGPDGTFFMPGTAKPTRALTDFLGTLAEGISLIKETELVITGHSDSTPLKRKGGYGNFDLSVDRAAVTRRLLANDGVPDSRFREVVGLGSRKPVMEDPRDPLNQRVTLDIYWVAQPRLDKKEAPTVLEP